jgi:hypothetical protein
MKKRIALIFLLLSLICLDTIFASTWFNKDDYLHPINPNWGIDLRENDIVDACNYLPYATDICDIGSDSLRIGELYLAGPSIHIGDSATIESVISYTNVTGDPFYQGSGGLDDLTSSGLYTGSSPLEITIRIEIDSTGTPNTFQWAKDGVVQATGVAITGSQQLLSDGIYITFAATTGHKNKDKWIFGAGYRLREDQAMAIEETLSVDSDGIFAGEVEAFGMVSHSDITHANGDIIIETQVDGDSHSIIYEDETGTEKISITWTDDAGDGELSFDGSADVSFDTDLLFLDYSADEAGLNTTDPKTTLHIVNGGATTGMTTVPAGRGLAITGGLGQSRLYFENVANTAGERVFQISNNEGSLRFASLTDTAAAFVNQYIFNLDHDTGNVGTGTGEPEYPSHVRHASAGYALIETDLNGGDTGLLFRNSAGENGYVKGLEKVTFILPWKIQATIAMST